MPVPKALVQAYDKSLNSETLLGETIANKEGKYSITYTQIGAGKENPDIEVQAIDNRDNKRVIGRSGNPL